MGGAGGAGGAGSCEAELSDTSSVAVRVDSGGGGLLCEGDVRVAGEGRKTGGACGGGEEGGGAGGHTAAGACEDQKTVESPHCEAISPAGGVCGSLEGLGV